jgi:hypothetical protein
MNLALLTACLTTCAMPLQAQGLLSEASGNWGGTDNDGFYFRAELTTAEPTEVRLRIWNGSDAVPDGGAAQFDNPAIALSAYATLQELALEQTEAGTTLSVVTEFADEEGEGREVLQIAYIDNQFTVTRYTHNSITYNLGGERIPYSCDVNFVTGLATANGVRGDLPPTDFEALNASNWAVGAAFERGYCPRME